jgi:hypothetical protein
VLHVPVTSPVDMFNNSKPNDKVFFHLFIYTPTHVVDLMTRNELSSLGIKRDLQDAKSCIIIIIIIIIITASVV